jgi:hypothetical protein
MRGNHQARWISKERRAELKKNGALKDAVLLDSFNGFLIVEPVDSKLGDGPTLSREEADYELRDAWCFDARTKLTQARTLLGLAPEPSSEAAMGV